MLTKILQSQPLQLKKIEDNQTFCPNVLVKADGGVSIFADHFILPLLKA